jgi:LPS-assembly protein
MRSLLLLVFIGLLRPSPLLAAIDDWRHGPSGVESPQASPAPQTPVATSAAPSTQPAPAQPGLITKYFNSQQGTIEWLSTDHVRLTTQVEIPVDATSKFSADQVDIHFDTNLLVASGNVVFASGEGQIAADSVDFNMLDGTATFHVAFGVMGLGAQADPSQFIGQDPDVYFSGQTIEKLGPRRYRITRGSFTTCVQPEPRWEIVSGSMVINLNDYAVARNTVLRVKGVPVLYLPLIYYPIQDDQRATGMLMPTYGSSRLRGQAISNGFFWAIGRSQDATFVHDWFTRTGQGFGTEYRYVAGPQSAGDVRFYRFNQRNAQFANGRALQAGTSYQVTGTAVHALTPTLRLRARLDYASDIISQQLYQQSIYRSTNPMRAIEGGVSGAWAGLTANAFYQRTEVFTNETESTLYGSTPRLSAAMSGQRLFGLPIYGSVNSEYAYLPYERRRNGAVSDNRSLSRADFAPSVRVPLSTLTFLTVNSNASFRTTYYSKSTDTKTQAIVPEPLTRNYLSLRSEVVGPVLNKIWDTPNSTRRERMKHVIEPAFSAEYITEFQAASVPILTDNSDIIVGGATRLTYGVTNRLFLRGRGVGTRRGTSREFLTIGVQQTYYSNEESSRYDTQYYSSSGRPQSDLSPIAVTTRLAPNDILDTNVRLEYDVTGIGLQTVSAGGSIRSEPVTTSLNYSRVRQEKDRLSSHYLSASNTFRLADGRVAGTYALSWDLERAYVVSQGITASYMAQCCGVQVEYQQFNYPDTTAFPVSSDRRINFGVVLAGLGPISNFFGAFGGQ